ncbi:craniofacial development protein 1-like [Centruroides sculpturatus]|uniref:craniofacial development protein 1-like n=1 Tax=Centruroides sculpturatus TaxID=218467 RepID=UPI000C6DB2F7|nr:craniofacial development protein 1-like [Centruroides sculpturatus]
METEPDFEEQSSTDEDYVPSGEESDEFLSGEEFASSKRGRSKTKRTRAKSKRKTVKSRKRKRGNKSDDDYEDDEDDDDDFNNGDDNSDSVNESDDNTNDDDVSNGNETGKKLPEVDKKKSDSLWADFLKDVEPPAKSKPKTEQNLQTQSDSVKQKPEKASVPNKKIITEVFDFAGESVSVTKEVDVDSEEAKKFENKDENKAAEQPESNKSAQVGCGIVHKEFLPLGQTVNQAFYKDVLEQLQKWINQVCRDSAEDWVLHHDNAPAHTALSRQRYIESALSEAVLSN